MNETDIAVDNSTMDFTTEPLFTTPIPDTNNTFNTNTTNTTTPKPPAVININITLHGNESLPTATTAKAMTIGGTVTSPSSSMTSVIASGTTTLAAAVTTTVSNVDTTVIGQSTNTWMGLSMSNTLLITVFTGCTALILLVLCVICCRLLCLKSRRESTTTGDRIKRQTTLQQSGNHYADPRVVENHYHSNDVTKFYATPELTYARPQIYSTFINPSFYEDVYARWKLQEQARFERTYEPTQYSRQLKDQMDTPGFKWSANSIRVLDSYDYDTYGKIPRGKLTSVDTDAEDAETVTMETAPEFSTF